MDNVHSLPIYIHGRLGPSVTSAWSDRGGFYPPGTKPAEKLPFSSSIFPIVEVDTTSYRIPPRLDLSADRASDSEASRAPTEIPDSLGAALTRVRTRRYDCC